MNRILTRGGSLICLLFIQFGPAFGQELGAPPATSSTGSTQTSIQGMSTEEACAQQIPKLGRRSRPAVTPVLPARVDDLVAEPKNALAIHLRQREAQDDSTLTQVHYLLNFAAPGLVLPKDALKRFEQANWLQHRGLNPYWKREAKQKQAEGSLFLPKPEVAAFSLQDPNVRKYLRELGATGPALEAPPADLVKELRELRNSPTFAADMLAAKQALFSPARAESGYPKDEKRPAFLMELMQELGEKYDYPGRQPRPREFQSPGAQNILRLILEPKNLKSPFLAQRFHPANFPAAYKGVVDQTGKAMESAAQNANHRGMTNADINVAAYLAQQNPIAATAEYFKFAKPIDKSRLLERGASPAVLALAQDFLKIAAEGRKREREFSKNHVAAMASGIKTAVTTTTVATEPGDAEKETKAAPAPETKAFDLADYIRDLPRKNRFIPTEAMQSAAKEFSRFFRDVGQKLVERETILAPIRLALLGRVHLNMEGPPGTAKSMAANATVGKIVEDDGQNSYFTMQFTKETGANEIFGPLDPRKLMDEGQYRRNMENFAARARFAFFDEAGDARPDARRLLLGLFNERRVSVGGIPEAAQLDTAFNATNQSKFEDIQQAGDRSAAAYYDRILYHLYIPGAVQFLKNAMKLVKNGIKLDHAPLKHSDLKQLQSIIEKVDLPDDSNIALATIFQQMDIATRDHFLESATAYFKAKPNDPDRPKSFYLPTRIYSPRSLTHTGTIAKDGVVNEWIDKPQRELTVELEDIEKLRPFLTMTSADEGFLKKYIAHVADPLDRASAEAALWESQTFSRLAEQLIQDIKDEPLSREIADVAARAKKSPNADSESEEKWIRHKLGAIIREGQLAENQIEAADYLGGDLKQNVYFIAALRAKRQAETILKARQPEATAP